MKYLITGGGTGGHIYPALAIADAIKKNDPDCKMLYVGVKGKAEENILKDTTNIERFEIKFIHSSGLPRKFISAKFLKFLFSIIIGILQGVGILVTFKPDVIIGTGGYGSFPIFFANIFFNKKSFIHEQNVCPGLANKIIGKISKRIGVSFKETLKFFPENKTVFVGYPLRWKTKGFNKEASKIKFGFQPNNKIIFFFGGSQGSRSINNAVFDSLNILLEKKDIGIVHGTGRYISSEYDAYLNTVSKLNKIGIEGSIPGKYLIQPYFTNVDEVYSATDLVVARSGAGTVIELAAMGIPSILIPKSLVPGNHQYFNAKALADVGGTVIVKEEIITKNNKKFESVNSKLLIKIILDIIYDETKLKRMSESVKQIYIPDSVERICSEIYSLVE